MPSVVVSCTQTYTVFVIPKGVTLLTSEDNREAAPNAPWSWDIWHNTLTYWDDKGQEHKIKGNEQESCDGAPYTTEIDDGANWGYDSSDTEEDDLLCMKCNTEHEGNWCPEAEEAICVDSCECENNPDNWNHCAECSHKFCDLGPNAEEGWTYDDDKEIWLCPDCCEGSEK
jgi:hypothetical protein